MSWLHQHLTLVVGWLVTFLSSVVTSVLLAPLVSHRLRRASESRDAHFAELKENLLEPMLQFVREHILPILDHQRGNVGISRKLLPRPSAGVMEDPTDYTEDFCVRDVAEAPIDPTLDAPDDKVGWVASKGPLYLDASQRHFHKVFKMWGDLTKELAQYHVSCITKAERLRSEIANASSLPEFRLDPNVPEWVNARSLALVILYRQLGLAHHRFVRPPEGHIERLVYKSSYTLAQGPPGEIARVVSRLDQLMKQTEALDGLKADAARIKSRALMLMTELESLLMMRKLRGKCKYLA